MASRRRMNRIYYFTVEDEGIPGEAFPKFEQQIRIPALEVDRAKRGVVDHTHPSRRAEVWRFLQFAPQKVLRNGTFTCLWR